MSALKRALRALFARVEQAGDLAFTPALNPFGNLGALGWFFYWIVAVSGIYLYAFFDTGITEAWESVEVIMREHFYVGSVMRGLHRYASDALVVVVFLHLAREFSLDRLRGPRWFAWFTGVPLIWLIYICGVSGYWMVWDLLAQYLAVLTTEWLDTLPFFGEPIAANFLSSATLSSRFFTLMVFIHIAVPLMMLLLMWIHVQRLTNANTNPPRALAAGTLTALVVLSLVFPATSQPPADLGTVPAVVRLDWFYLAGYPLLDRIPGGALWLIVGGVTLALASLPWLPPERRQPAVVNLEGCNGCARCVADCPYSAITLAPRTDGAPFDTQAVVNVSNCVSCGICAGACPTATPFRRAGPLVPGIELPDARVAELRERTLAAAATHAGGLPVLVFGCDAAGALESLAGPDVAVLRLPCVGALPPPFIDWVLARGHAAAVLVAGCSPGRCYYRLGDEWTRQRVARECDPYLRARVPRELLRLSFESSAAGHARALASLRKLLESRGVEAVDG